MSENTTTDGATNGDATTENARPTGGYRYRVQGSLQLTVTVTASSPDEAVQAVPAAVTDIFAGMPAAVIAADGVAGVATPLPSAGTQPSQYQVPVTVYGHVDLTGDNDADMPAAALNAVAAYLGGRDDVRANLSSAVCDQVGELIDEQPTE